MYVFFLKVDRERWWQSEKEKKWKERKGEVNVLMLKEREKEIKWERNYEQEKWISQEWEGKKAGGG